MLVGGYIAAEFSHVAARAGAKVTILQHGERMLKHFDHDLVGWLIDKFNQFGIDVRTNAEVTAIEIICGGSQSFNAVNQMRILGRWMRMVTIPNQSSVPKAWLEFDDDGRMKPSSYYNRVVDVMEELMKFTILTRDRSAYLTDRYSERVESVEEVHKRVGLKNI